MPEENKTPEENELKEGEESVETPDPKDAEIASLKAELEKRSQIQTDMEAKLKDSKSIEEFNEVVAESAKQVADLNRQLMHESISNQFSIPEKFKKFVVGDSEDEMRSAAKELAEGLKVAVPGSTNRSGGGASGTHVGEAEELPDDPGELAKLVPRNGGLTSL